MEPEIYGTGIVREFLKPWKVRQDILSDVQYCVCYSWQIVAVGRRIRYRINSLLDVIKPVTTENMIQSFTQSLSRLGKILQFR